MFIVDKLNFFIQKIYFKNLISFCFILRLNKINQKLNVDQILVSIRITKKWPNSHNFFQNIKKQCTKPYLNVNIRKRI